MQLIDNQNTQDPSLNLALEEYAVRNFPPEEDYVLCYVNAPSVVLGKHQNVFEEVNWHYAQEENIQIFRRISGGGTVYHDLGNLNFSFHTAYDKTKVNNYRHFNRPIVEALQSLGIPAEMNARNDIIAEGKKISGNAQFSTTKKMISHGTLLLSAERHHLSEVLKVKPQKIESKSVKSVRSKVANIREFLEQPMTIEALQKILLKYIFGGEEPIPTYHLRESEWQAVEKLAEEKYRTWAWNIGRSPAFTIHKKHSFDFGLVMEASIEVKAGKVTRLTLHSDKLSPTQKKAFEKGIEGAIYTPEGLQKALQVLDLPDFLSQINLRELVEFLFC